MSMKAAEAAPTPKLVVLNRAFKLAEQWVNDMSGTEEEETHELELESRPSRLGIGATPPPEAMHEMSNDPVGRKLHAKLHDRKVKSDKDLKEWNRSVGGDHGDEDCDSDEEFVSKTDVFTKRKPVSQAPYVQLAKKRSK